MTRIEKIPRKQMRQIIRSFKNEFATWELTKRLVYMRDTGIIRQIVAFDSLRFGAYRPVNTVTIIKGVRIMPIHQFLDIKHRVIELPRHEAMHDAVATAMHEQFRPPINQPLDENQVLTIAESVTTSRPGECCGLAILNAHLGYYEKALQWCDKVPTALQKLGRDLTDFEQDYQEKTTQLEEAIHDSPTAVRNLLNSPEWNVSK